MLVFHLVEQLDELFLLVPLDGVLFIEALVELGQFRLV